jgi:energy-coupling factor transporter ATP-binding protein EcfA2
MDKKAPIRTIAKNGKAIEELKNPFPGLRPFTFAEKHLFYGREGQSEKVLELLTENRFAAVIGPSGSGKSSLIQCGVIPQLYGGYLYNAGSVWKIARMNPGYSPIEAMSVALAEVFAPDPSDKDKLLSEANLNYVLLTQKSLEISDLLKRNETYKNENILLFIDQFEELFRFTTGLEKLNQDEFDETLRFINIIDEALTQDQVPVYVVLCIRSDFVGSCSNYHSLTEYINKSHYLVSQMTREHYKSAILGPMSYSNVTIAPDLLQEILNNTGNTADQLPVLQHLMMRVFDRWKSKNQQDRSISIYDYKDVGGLKEAISHHADELYDQLDENQQKICKRIFQTLTESGADNKGIRRPTSIKNISKILRVKKEEIIAIADLFRKKGNSFLTPDPSIPLTEATILDITHESVMRNWKRLKNWIDEESDAVQLYLRLVEASGLYQSGKAGTWRPPELLLAVNWRDQFEPNDVWAAQYHPAFARSMKFLEISESTYQDELAEKERLQRREIRRTRWFAAIIGVAAIVSLGLMLNSLYLRNLADEARAEAEEQRELAEANALEADKQKNIALRYAEELEIQKEIIENNLIITEVQRDDAVRTADAAFIRVTKTEEDLEEMSRDKEIAEQTTQEALEEKQRAEEASRIALRDKIRLLTQTLSAQSLEMSGNRTLAALLAYQAYKFNRQYEGPENNPDIYRSIKHALANLNVDYPVQLGGHTSSVRSIAIQPRNGSLFSAGSDGMLNRYARPSLGTDPETILTNNSINRIVTVTHDGRWLICASEGIGIQVIDLSDPGRPVKTFRAHQNRIRGIAVYHDNQHILTCGLDKSIIRWDLASGTSEVLFEPDNQVQTIAISPNDRTIAIGTKDGYVFLYNNAPGSRPEVLFHNTGIQMLSMVFRRRDNALICGDQQGNLRIWSLSTNRLIYNQDLHQARIVEVKTDPSERYIATASTDGKALLLDSRNMNLEPIVIDNFGGFVFSVEFSRDGKKIYVANNSSRPLLGYPVSLADIAAFICPNVSRNLTRAEWADYIGEDVPYEKTCD